MKDDKQGPAHQDKKLPHRTKLSVEDVRISCLVNVHLDRSIFFPKLRYVKFNSYRIASTRAYRTCGHGNNFKAGHRNVIIGHQ